MRTEYPIASLVTAIATWCTMCVANIAAVSTATGNQTVHVLRMLDGDCVRCSLFIYSFHVRGGGGVTGEVTVRDS